MFDHAVVSQARTEYDVEQLAEAKFALKHLEQNGGVYKMRLRQLFAGADLGDLECQRALQAEAKSLQAIFSRVNRR